MQGEAAHARAAKGQKGHEAASSAKEKSSAVASAAVS